jgi:hypothetical protein
MVFSVVVSEERTISGTLKLNPIPTCLEKLYQLLCPTFLAPFIPVIKRHFVQTFYVGGTRTCKGPRAI